MFEEIGRFKILEELGQGAMATVYKAYDPKIDRNLAIKVLREERCADAEYRARFLKEAKAAGILSHPNIVTVYDVGEVGDRPYIVMELLEGTPLDRLMKSGERYSVSDVVDLGLQLARALGFAHEKGIVHRDVKPSNIVKKGNVVKVTDFGIARIESGESARQTHMGQILGTPQYMSPEQVVGKDVDARSDLFSLGVVLYQLLSGHTPFEADTITSLLFKIATEEPAPLEIPPDLPLSLKRVIERLLKKQPDKRFANAKELADALEAVQRELREAEERREMPRVIPLRVRWTAIMAAIVAVTMVISITFISGRQHKLLQDQAVGYGTSLVRFMAVESAVPVLSEDWASIELFIQETMARQSFKYLAIADHKGIVHGSSDPAWVGKKYEQAAGTAILKAEDVTVSTRALPSGEAILDFDAAIYFQKKEVGRVHLGVPRGPLQRVTTVSVYLMLLLMAVTICAVTVVTYLLGNYVSRPVRTLTFALGELAGGRYDFRITEKRTDEFGRLFHAFDKTAEAMQKRHQDETGGAPE